MDSQHRHELKENDLEEFLKHSGDAWKKYGTQLLTLIAIGMAAFMVARYFNGREARNLEAAYSTLANASSPRAKIEAADEHGSIAGFKGKAMLDAADQLSREAIFGVAASAGNNPLAADDRKKNLTQAAETYQKVIDLKHSPLQVLYARFNLAATQESLGNFAGARVQYEAIQKEAGENWPHMANAAKNLAKELDRIATPIEFPAPPKPETPAPAAGAPGALPPGHPPIGPVPAAGPAGPVAPVEPAGPVPVPAAPTPAPVPAPAAEPAKK